MHRRAALVAALVSGSLLACGGKKEPAAKAPVAAAPQPPAVDAAPARPARPAPAPVSRAARAEYKKRLAAGRKAAKAARWPEAIADFEAALAAIPGDDRALGELSWAAFSAGDHARARKAGKESVLATTEPSVKAASLYNLGRVEEATGKLAEAAALYRQSLALRPNKTVEARLAGLGKDVPLGPDELPCTAPLPEPQLCSCLLAAAQLEDPATGSCEVEPTAVDGFRLASYGTEQENTNVLLAGGADGWAVVAHLDDVYNPGMAGIFEDWSLVSVKAETVAGKQVVRVVTRKSRQDSDAGIDEVENEDRESLVVCVRGDGKTPTRCPLDVTTSYSYVRDRLGLAEDDEMTDVADLRTKGLPIRSEMQLSVEVGADGIAKVRAVRGRVEPSLLGDVKLW